MAGTFKRRSGDVIKALCCACNLNRASAASRGKKYHGERMTSIETALDFLMEEFGQP